MIGAGLSLYSGSKTLLQRAMDVLRSFPGSSSYPFSSLQGAYQTSAGPAAAAVNDPIGLELDAMGVVGGETVPAAGWFSTTGADVVKSVPAGTLTITNSAGFGSGCDLAASTVASKWYLAVYTVVFTVPASGVSIKVGSVAGAPHTSDGIYSEYIYATAGSAPVVFTNGAGVSCVISNISIKEVTGNHATQSTAINRPTVQRGLWNLALTSQQYQAFAFNAATTPPPTNNSATYRDGTLTAWTIASGSTGTCQANYTIPASVGTYTWCLEVKPTAPGATFTTSLLGVFGIDTWSGVFNLDTLSTLSGMTATPLGGGWYLLTRVFTNDGSGALFLNRMDAGAVPDATVYGRAGIFQGTLTAAQILQQGGIPLTTSQAGSNPTAGPYWTSFNGTNQSMALSSVPFQMADDHSTTVCFQIGTLPGGNWGAIAPACGAGFVLCGSIGINSVGNIGAFYIDDSLTYIALFSPAAYAPGQVVVVSEVKRGTVNYLRVNGVQVATGSLAALGVMTVTTGYIGQGATSGDYATAGIYYAAIIKGTVTDAQLLTLEKAAAQRAGITL